MWRSSYSALGTGIGVEIAEAGAAGPCEDAGDVGKAVPRGNVEWGDVSSDVPGALLRRRRVDVGSVFEEELDDVDLVGDDGVVKHGPVCFRLDGADVGAARDQDPREFEAFVLLEGRPASGGEAVLSRVEERRSVAFQPPRE